MSAAMKRAMAVLLLLVGAGCVTPPPPAPIPNAKALDLAKPFTWTVNLTQCHEGDLLLFVPKDQLQQQLPPGFHVADAQQITGAPAAPLGTGPRGMILANAFACGTNTLGSEPVSESQITILIDPPNVPGERPKEIFDFYELARVAPNVKQRAVFDALGWEAFDGNVTLTATDTSADAKVQQMKNDSFAFTTSTPTGPPTSGVGRFWQAVPTGIVYVDYTVGGTTQTLGSAQCTIAAGSMLAKVSGLSGCGPGDAAGGGFTTFDTSESVHYLPNATAS